MNEIYTETENLGYDMRKSYYVELDAPILLFLKDRLLNKQSQIVYLITLLPTCNWENTRCTLTFQLPRLITIECKHHTQYRRLLIYIHLKQNILKNIQYREDLDNKLQFTKD